MGIGYCSYVEVLRPEPTKSVKKTLQSDFLNLKFKDEFWAKVRYSTLWPFFLSTVGNSVGKVYFGHILLVP